MILIICSAIICHAQTKIYKLKSKTINTDFDYYTLNNLDAVMQMQYSMQPLKGFFNPVKGKFIVYKFLAIYKGESFNDKIQVFHDILIIKTDKYDNVIDAYKCNLEWTAPPLGYDLYKFTVKNCMLTDKLTIDQLQLVRTCYSDEKEKGELLNEKGIISFKTK